MEYNTYIFFPAIFLLSFVQFKRNKGLIKECPINEKNSPNHCVKLKYWERKWFKVDVLYIPKMDSRLASILTVVPLQMFAYHCATARGCDVDKPRNLAKSVTVE